MNILPRFCWSRIDQRGESCTTGLNVVERRARDVKQLDQTWRLELVPDSRPLSDKLRIELCSNRFGRTLCHTNGTSIYDRPGNLLESHTPPAPITDEPGAHNDRYTTRTHTHHRHMREMPCYNANWRIIHENLACVCPFDRHALGKDSRSSVRWNAARTQPKTVRTLRCADRSPASMSPLRTLWVVAAVCSRS